MKAPFDIKNINANSVSCSAIKNIKYSDGTNGCYVILKIVKGSKLVLLRVTASDRDFKSILAIDLLNDKFEAVGGLGYDSNLNAAEDIVASTVEAIWAAQDKEAQSQNFALFRQKESPVQWSWGKEPTYLKAALLGTAVGFIPALLQDIRRWGPYYCSRIRNAIEAKHVSTTVEEQLNEALFKGQDGTESEFECYSETIHAIESLVTNPKIHCVILCGMPGTSKTYIVRRTLHFLGQHPGKDYITMKGASLGIKDFYRKLWHEQDKLIVMDDFDTPLKDPDTCNLIKAATDSYEQRIVSMPLTSERINQSDDFDEAENIPENFNFTGKILIITNLPLKDIEPALISRALTIEVKFTLDEFLKNIELMLKYISPDTPFEIKQEVLDFVSEMIAKKKIHNINFRTFGNAICMRELYPDSWKKMILKALK